MDCGGWSERDGKIVYLDFHGNPIRGWLETEEGRFYFDENHAVSVGWTQIGDAWYYFDPVGMLQTGWQEIDGGCTASVTTAPCLQAGLTGRNTATI